MNIHRKAIPMPGGPQQEPRKPLEGEVVNVELWRETDSGEYHVDVKEAPPADWVAEDHVGELFLPWSARLKADGCVDLRREYPGDEDEDYMHICNLEEFVEQMKALLLVQKRHKFPLY